MATMQLNIDPKSTILISQTLTTSKDSDVKAFDMFTIIGVQVNVSSAAGLTASVKIQVSIDGVNWGDYAGSSVAVTGDTVIPYNISDFAFNFLKVSITVSAGSAVFEALTVAKQG